MKPLTPHSDNSALECAKLLVEHDARLALGASAADRAAGLAEYQKWLFETIECFHTKNPPRAFAVDSEASSLQLKMNQSLCHRQTDAQRCVALLGVRAPFAPPGVTCECILVAGWTLYKSRPGCCLRR